MLLTKKKEALQVRILDLVQEIKVAPSSINDKNLPSEGELRRETELIHFNFSLQIFSSSAYDTKRILFWVLNFYTYVITMATLSLMTVSCIPIFVLDTLISLLFHGEKSSMTLKTINWRLPIFVHFSKYIR